MKICVLGSGNGACATAADWSMHGHEVNMCDLPAFGSALDAVYEQGGIYCMGDFEGFARLGYVGTDLAQALDGVELILAVGPSYSSEPFAEALKDLIKANQVYVLSPGSNGGALATKKIFSDVPGARDVVIGESSTLPYAARIMKPGTVKIYLKLRGGVFLSAIPFARTQAVLDMYQQVYPFALASDSIFKTILQNANPVIHPTVTLMNAALIERTNGDFLFYEEGVTPAVGRVMEAIDNERIAIGAKLGAEILPDPELGVLQGYMLEANYSTGYSTAPGFKGIKAQKELNHRYLHEDAGYGLVFLSELGASVGVETPAIDAVLKLASIVVKRDYRKEAVRTLAGMGYSVKDVQAL